MARALTAPELTNLRKDSQHSRLYLAVHTPASVYTARVNGVPASDDKVPQITYDGGAGTPAEAIAGMTVYVGSTAGACDVGKVRLRATLAAAAGTMKIGETSEITWTDNDYLTVVDEFGLWPRHLRIDSNGTVYMDYDVEYSDQHEDCDPVPVLGPPAVAWLTGATVDVEFDGSDSWVPGSTIASYAWLAPGSSATSGLATATPTITYDAAGTYRVSCEVTATNGATFTGYRYVFVYDDSNPPATVFRLGGCSGEWSRGGWSFQVTMWDEATRVELLDRAMVVLFARDWYGSTETSIGPVADRENVIAVGWIENESIDWQPEQGSVSFTVQGPQFWLSKMQGFPSGVEDYDGTPSTWLQFEDLTVDKGLWHFLHWRTTASLCMDWILTGDTRQISVFDAPPGSLWQQITREASRTILAHPCCDRYGRLFVEIDSQFLPVGDRGAIPTVQTLLKAEGDWRAGISIERITVASVSMLDLSGVAYLNGVADAYFALSPGRVFKRYGDHEGLDRVALTDQAQVNVLSGLILGNRNNEYPHIDIPLAANHRGFDICPHQYGVISIIASDTERGIELTSQKMVPRRVSFTYDPRTGVFLTDVDFEAYTTAETGITGDPPPEPPEPPVVTPTLPPLPPEPEVPVNVGAFALCQDQIGITLNIGPANPTWWHADPNNDLAAAGTLLNVALYGNKAYLTSHDATDTQASGLWYCSDVTDLEDWSSGTIWTLVKSAYDAAGEVGGYDAANPQAGKMCMFGAIGVNKSGEFCIPIHSASSSSANRPHTPGSGAYIGQAGSLSLTLFDGISNWFVVGPPIVQHVLHCVDYDDGVSAWHIGGTEYISPNWEARVADYSGGPWGLTDWFAKVPFAFYFEYNMACVGGGYVVSDQAPSSGGQIYENWNKSEPVWADGTKARQLTGLYVGNTTHYLYTNVNDHDKLMQDGIEIADGPTEFGDAGANGGTAIYVIGSDEEIIWILGNQQAFADVNVVIYSPDNGTTWEDKTGDLQTALGSPANWSGRTDGNTGNAIIRTFEI